MLKDLRKTKIFNRRALFISSLQGGLATILLTNLSYLQLFKHKAYQTKSNSNSIKLFLRPSKRGEILDRNGFYLTENHKIFRLYYYVEGKNNEKIIENLTEILDLDDEKKENLEKIIKKAKIRSHISLIDSLSWQEMAKIMANSYRLQGAFVEKEYQRFYPYSESLAHVLGYISLPNSDEINENNKELFLHPSFRVGKRGIEKSYDEFLRGKYGIKYVEVDAREKPIRTISVKKPQIGHNFVSSINLELQNFTYDLLKDKIASAVVLDINNGEVLTSVSTPSFDPNKFVEGVSHEYWQEIAQNKKFPLNNRATSAVYPPGSIFKLMTALAALEAGISPKIKHNCDGSFQLGRRKFHCWKEEGHGNIDMIQAIEGSCNVYFYNLAKEVGIARIEKTAKKFGYGQKFQLGEEFSRIGNLPTKAWKKKVFKQSWVQGDTLNSSIGQGFILACPMQMAVAMARIANGGYKITPTLIKNKQKLTDFEKIEKSENLDIILKGVYGVVNSPKGTAFYNRITESGFEMAGKSGTSQVISKRYDEMSDFEKEINANKSHAIFTAFAPFHNPKYAVAVVVEHGGSGSSVAAPIAKEILLKAQGIQSKKSGQVE